MNKDSTIVIYIVWDVNADSWNAQPYIRSMHQTLQGAREAIPENIRQLKREPYGNFIENYDYRAIERRSVGA